MIFHENRLLADDSHEIPCRIFQGSRGGPTFSKGGGGVQLFPGGSNCLFPIETHITCDFPGGGGGVRTPCPPPDPHLN